MCFFTYAKLEECSITTKTQQVARGAKRGFSCYFKHLCAEFDPVRQASPQKDRQAALIRGVVCALAGKVMSPASNSVLMPHLTDHLNEKF
jgi:hypothetical protein